VTQPSTPGHVRRGLVRGLLLKVKPQAYMLNQLALKVETCLHPRLDPCTLKHSNCAD
jgi:hypothetical protein